MQRNRYQDTPNIVVSILALPQDIQKEIDLCRCPGDDAQLCLRRHERAEISQRVGACQGTNPRSSFRCWPVLTRNGLGFRGTIRGPLCFPSSRTHKPTHPHTVHRGTLNLAPAIRTTIVDSHHCGNGYHARRAGSDSVTRPDRKCAGDAGRGCCPLPACRLCLRPRPAHHGSALPSPPPLCSQRV